MNGLYSYEFQHPLVGRLTGRRMNQHVVQFRSIPYGYIPARFRQARLIEHLSPKQRVCVDYSYACPQTEQSMDAFGGPIPGTDQRRYDEFSCLNLTVTAPVAALEPGCVEKLPVLVYVHGGGFQGGAHYGGTQDMTRMVTLSCQESKPVIIDLLDDAVKNNEEPCNFGLFDQRLAFIWIQRNIPGFGGDKHRVTAFGESAGSASLSFHMSSNVPLFNRVILQSGTAATISPTSCSQKNEEYLSLLAYCQIDRDNPRRLETLRELPVEKLVEAASSLTKSAFSPLSHETFFPTVPTFLNHDQIAADCSWVDAVILGDTVYEGYIFSHALKAVQPEFFCKHVSDTLGADRGRRLLGIYAISADMDRNLFWTRLCLLCGDLMFSLPCHQLARTAAKRQKEIYRYTLSLRNPFPGSIFSEVLGHHFIDLAYQFMTLMERFPQQKQKDISVAFARQWIDFANGHAPWEPFTLEGGEAIAVADSREGWVVRTRAEDLACSVNDEGGQRRYEMWEASDAVLRELGAGAAAAAAALSFPTLVTLVDA